MLQIENIKLFRRKILWIEIAIIAILVVLVAGVGIFVMTFAPEDADAKAEMQAMLRWPAGIMVGAGMAAGNQLGGIMMMALVSAVVTQDYQCGTLALLLGRGVPRPLALITKLAVTILAALVLSAAATLLGILASAIFTLIVDGALPLQIGDLRHSLLVIGANTLTMLPYLTLTLLIAVLTRSSIAAISSGIGALIAEAVLTQVLPLFGNLTTQIAMGFPSVLSRQLFAGISSAEPIPGILHPALAAVVLVAYGIVFSILALWAFRNQDLGA
jgi:ABC-2 type transport system permease protein